MLKLCIKMSDILKSTYINARLRLLILIKPLAFTNNRAVCVLYTQTQHITTCLRIGVCDPNSNWRSIFLQCTKYEKQCKPEPNFAAPDRPRSLNVAPARRSVCRSSCLANRGWSTSTVRVTCAYIPAKQVAHWLTGAAPRTSSGGSRALWTAYELAATG
jgi:hypothetical protein